MIPTGALRSEAITASPTDLRGFEPLRAPLASSAKLPKSLKIAVWNCRGIAPKTQAISSLFEVYDFDLLVLNETFRRAKTPWPSYLPPCLAEATSDSSSTTRSPNGVAILANPRSLGHRGRIRSFSVIDCDNIHGLKVVLKINQFTIFAVYAPTSTGTDLLTQFTHEAKELAACGDPVVFCGDLNVPREEFQGMDHVSRTRHRVLHDNLGPLFFRVDTGEDPTRPANRVDSVSNAGSFIDHIFVANANGLAGRCHSDFAHTSDHHPISAQLCHRRPPDDNSVKYWRLRLERLKQDAIKEAYFDAVHSELTTLHSVIIAACPSTLTRLSPVLERQTVVDHMERHFIHGIMSIAQRVIGRKAVPVAPSGKSPSETEDYRSTASALSATYDDLRRFARLGPDHPRVSALLLKRDELKATLKTIELSAQRSNYSKWRDDLCKLPVSQRLKVLNRCMRRRSAAGACLSTTPIALQKYRDHFAKQFRNELGIDPHPEALPGLHVGTELAIAMLTFQPDIVHEMTLRSPAGKAPGISGMSAELLHPIAELISPTLAAMFTVYMSMAVVPSSWKRALICPVPKKGDLSHICNYRPISLTEVTRKIFEMCVLNRFQAGSEITLSREQGGFREGRSTIDQIECLDRVIRHVRQQGKKVCMAFLDIKAAYDSVPRGELWRQCEQQELEHVSISCLRSLFDHNSAQLVINQSRSDPFSLPAGVLQGSVLSPLLYSIYLDPLVHKLRSSGPRISLPRQTEGINAFLYADDIALIASSPLQLRRLLQIAEADSLARGYRFSPSKCVVVGTDRYPQRLYDAPLVRQSSFCYLGIEVDHRGLNSRLHATSRATKALKAAERLRQVGARFRNFPAVVNIQLYAAFIRPGLEYGIVLLSRHRGAMYTLQTCQKKILCSLLGVHLNARHDVIEGVTNCSNLSVRCQILRTRRAEKLQGLWNQDNCTDHALIFVLQGIAGDLSIDSELLPFRTPVLIRADLHFRPITASLAERYGGFINVGTLRWLLLSRLPDGTFRTILLWLLQRWRIFTSAKLCLHCQGPFNCQYHVVSCTGMRYRLVEDCPVELLELDAVTHLPEAVVEHTLALTMEQTIYAPDLSRVMLIHIESVIRASIEQVFGPRITSVRT